MAAVRFPKPEVVLSQHLTGKNRNPEMEISHRNLVCK